MRARAVAFMLRFFLLGGGDTIRADEKLDSQQEV
jgi:hypothetical protein